MGITVRNVSRTSFVLNLARGVDYGDHPECKGSRFEMAQSVELPDGSVGSKLHKKSLPGALTWLAGETKEDLPDHIKKIEQFKRAVATRILLVVQPAEEASKPADGKADAKAPEAHHGKKSKRVSGEGDSQ